MVEHDLVVVKLQTKKLINNVTCNIIVWYILFAVMYTFHFLCHTKRRAFFFAVFLERVE